MLRPNGSNCSRAAQHWSCGWKATENNINMGQSKTVPHGRNLLKGKKQNKIHQAPFSFSCLNYSALKVLTLTIKLFFFFLIQTILFVFTPEIGENCRQEVHLFIVSSLAICIKSLKILPNFWNSKYFRTLSWQNNHGYLKIFKATKAFTVLFK